MSFLSFLSLVFVFAFGAISVDAGTVAKLATRDPRWERKFLAPRDASIKLHLALRQQDGGAAAERHLMAISHPDSPHYRRHLRADEILDLSTPASSTVHAVEVWLAQHGLLASSVLFAGFMEVNATIRQAEKLLNTTYFVFSDGRDEIVRTELFHLPDHLNYHIDFVTPTTMFPRPAIKNASNAPEQPQRFSQDPMLGTRAGCGATDNVIPSCVRQVYDINYTAKPSRVTYAVYATESASFSPTDLHVYLSEYNPPAAAANANYTVIGTGDPSESSGGIEAQFETALDTQTLTGLAWPAHGILYNNGGVFGTQHPGQVYDRFVTFLQQLIANTTIPSVVSFSESMAETSLDPAYARRLCNMMAQVGTRGVTLLFSSGDNGPNGDQPSGTHSQIFEPEFPASCPWVTAVGGTTNLAAEAGATKSTIPLINKISYVASGGGFSTLFARPDYQSPAVTNYTATQIPASYDKVKGFNAQGRGIPDVAAFSTLFPTVVDLLTVPIGGTSASTPLWAAIVTLLNDYEASKGRPRLGFINPWLYSLKAGAGLKDITTGGNNVGSCYALQGCHLSETLGYNVTRGWDPVTGLGSPVFSKLLVALDARAAAAES
ncbi:peptidase S8/S53 domain-containing protein [Neohortaea acidophila]|uniref:Peptidase S8/S53 domain-containing protein n=1 Tax=Neohortaea acidophila TaxID=245834 RepID=A0A6A6Q5J6_9PEZI|nr:peptidase S8/S53 domain-containing protein [Neohortaea acidophila]KAF2487585.1 peptidase S8/S53 domain-containing protein [Neohortaea acidophila]